MLCADAVCQQSHWSPGGQAGAGAGSAIGSGGGHKAQCARLVSFLSARNSTAGTAGNASSSHAARSGDVIIPAYAMLTPSVLMCAQLYWEKMQSVSSLQPSPTSLTSLDAHPSSVPESTLPARNFGSFLSLVHNLPHHSHQRKMEYAQLAPLVFDFLGLAGGAAAVPSSPVPSSPDAQHAATTDPHDQRTDDQEVTEDSDSKMEVASASTAHANGNGNSRVDSDVQSSELNGREVVEWLARLHCNQFSITTQDSMNPIGGGVYCAMAMLNHSCRPNCTVMFHGNTAILRAIRTIAAGEPLTISYIDLANTSAERKRLLREGYFFDCNCERCQLDTQSSRDAVLDGLVCPDIRCRRAHRLLSSNSDSTLLSCTSCGGVFEASSLIAERSEATQLLQRAQSLLDDSHQSSDKKNMISNGDPWTLLHRAWSLATEVCHPLALVRLRILDRMVRAAIDGQQWELAAQCGWQLLPLYDFVYGEGDTNSCLSAAARRSAQFPLQERVAIGAKVININIDTRLDERDAMKWRDNQLLTVHSVLAHQHLLIGKVLWLLKCTEAALLCLERAWAVALCTLGADNESPAMNELRQLMAEARAEYQHLQTL